jgi:hypothetical protein
MEQTNEHLSKKPERLMSLDALRGGLTCFGL